MIGAYGQDDRICAFAELKAFLKITNSYKTAVGFFFDKEEINLRYFRAPPTAW